MCEFCKEVENGNEPIFFDFNKAGNKINKMSIAREGKVFCLKYKNKHENLSEMAEIYFCPMCGRKLGDD